MVWGYLPILFFHPFIKVVLKTIYMLLAALNSALPVMTKWEVEISLTGVSYSDITLGYFWRKLDHLYSKISIKLLLKV